MKTNRKKLKNNTSALKRYDKTEVKEILPYVTHNVGWRASTVEDKLVWTGETDYPSYSVRYDLDRTLYLSTPIDKSIEPLTSLRITFKVDELETGESQGIRFGTEVRSISDGDYVYTNFIDTTGSKEYVVNQKGVFWPTQDLHSLENYAMPMDDYKQYYYLPGISLNTVDHVVLSDIRVMPIKAWIPKPSKTKLTFNPLAKGTAAPDLNNTRDAEVFYVGGLPEYENNFNNMEIFSSTKSSINDTYVLMGLVNDPADPKGPYISVRHSAVFKDTMDIPSYGIESDRLYDLKMNSSNRLTLELKEIVDNNIKYDVILNDTRSIITLPKTELKKRFGGFYIDGTEEGLVHNPFKGHLAYKSILRKEIIGTVEQFVPVMEYFTFIQRENIPPYVPDVQGRPGSRVFHDETGTYYKIEMVNAGEFEDWSEISEVVPDDKKNSIFSDIYDDIAAVNGAVKRPEQSPHAVIKSTVELDALTKGDVFTLSSEDSFTIPGVEYDYKWTISSEYHTTTVLTPNVENINTTDYTDGVTKGNVRLNISLTITSKLDHTQTDTAYAVGSILCSSSYPIIAGMNGGYASISTDKGVAAWNPLPQGLNSGSTNSNINALASSGSSEETTFVAGLSGGYASISTDNGNTWKALPRGLNCGVNYHIYSLAVSGNSGETTFVAGMSSGYASISEDNGENWKALPQGLSSGSTRSNINTLAASEDTFVAGMQSGYASISTDKGKTWNPLPQGLSSGSRNDIYSLAASGNTFVAGLASGYASISEDRGATWKALPRGLNSGSNSTVYSLAASGDTFVAGVGYGNASISHDKGINWETLPRGLNSGAYSSSYALVSSGDTFVAGMDAGYASISTDKGKTWNPLPHGLNSGSTSSSIYALAVIQPPSDPPPPPPPPPIPYSIIMGMVKGYANISTDEGQTWTELPQGLNSGNVTRSISSLGVSGDTCVAGLQYAYASISEDKGETWRALPRGLNSGASSSGTIGINALAVSGDTFIAGLDSGYASISTDKGKTWEALERGLSSGYTGPINTLAVSGETFVAGMNDGYASISTDKGKTWSKLSRGLGNPVGYSVLSLAASGNTFVAGLGYAYASISEDGGKIWKALPRGLNSGCSNSINIHSLAASGDTFVAGMDQGYASISTDKGKTWKALPKGLNSGSTTSYINTIISRLNADGTITFIAGMDNGYCSISRDSGTTWTPLSDQHWTIVSLAII